MPTARCSLAAALAVAAALLPLRADDITDAIDEGRRQYEAGQYPEAASSLDYAATLIRQKRGGDLTAFLPGPLAGWEAGEPETSAAGAAVLGGLVQVTREYTRGDSRVSIQISADSPLFQQYSMMLTNPALIAASGAGRLQTIKGKRGLVQYQKDDRSGQVHVTLGTKFLVTVDGSEVTEKDLLDHMQAVDLAALEKQ